MSSSDLSSSDVSSSDVKPASRPGLGLALLGSELSVMFRRRRTWAMLLGLAAVPILIAVAIRVSGSNGRGPAFIGQISSNGFFVALTALTVSIPLFLPLTVGVVSGDAIAGEAASGTLRYLLVAPAGRVRLLIVKYLGAAVFSLAATLAVVVAATLIGLALFPIGPVTLLSGDTISVDAALLRSLILVLYVTVSLLGFSAIGLFISTLTDAPVGAIAGTVVLSVLSQVLDQLDQLDWLHPWLFTDHWLGFAGLVSNPISWDQFGSNLLVQAGYFVVFGALALGRFTTKDVLS
jgi:ABC-2 type transport system permease protein